MGGSKNEKNIISTLKEGDENTFKHIYSANYDKLCKYVYSLSNNASLAEDVVQDTLMYLWQKREDMHIRSSVSAYLYRSAFNRYMDICRKEKRQKTLMDDLKLSAIIEFEGFEEDKKEQYFVLLENIINKLPEKRKEIFILNKINSYKYKEIADMKGISVRTVESQIRKALITIRKEVTQLKFSNNQRV
ncbi:RNA polymerase sigma-70 factor [Flavivirga amylovorans]|uniref:RNA polymerase sigma-70 factor n=1 Tax=Flavivirga amylovorans TaxID=870486 RepID=A0ABT8WVW4_9FLAO|nr:RNA polymerase sigma-70 factor [Flavivirga amylovorans]MDO5985816.1 RNA polymerase sigma-70 factor [Flavivirga amylovorans]